MTGVKIAQSVVVVVVVAFFVWLHIHDMRARKRDR